MKPKELKDGALKVFRSRGQEVTDMLSSAKARVYEKVEDIQTLREVNRFAGEVGSNIRTALDVGEMMRHLATVKLIADKAMDSETPLEEINRALKELKKARKLAKNLV